MNSRSGAYRALARAVIAAAAALAFINLWPGWLEDRYDAAMEILSKTHLTDKIPGYYFP